MLLLLTLRRTYAVFTLPLIVPVQITQALRTLCYVFTSISRFYLCHFNIYYFHFHFIYASNISNSYFHFTLLFILFYLYLDFYFNFCGATLRSNVVLLLVLQNMLPNHFII